MTSISEDGVSASFYVYDAAGRRTGQTTAGVSFTYTYNGLNRVTSARDTAGRTRATWLYDSAGNVTDYREFKEDGTTLRRTVNTYYENGLTKTAQTIVPVKISDDEPKKDSTTTNHYDRSGRMVKQVVADATDPAKVTTYTYSFSYTADGRTTSVSVTGPKDASGNSTSTYDVNDRLVQLDKGKADGGEGNDILTFRHDNDGHVVWRRHDDGEDDTKFIPVTRFVYAGGNPVGETGNNDKNANFTLLDENGESGDGQEMQYRQVQNIGKEHPASTGSTYTAQGGDTLRKIAEATYGNASLWFLIADANGLTGDSPIKAGQQLRIPTSIESGKLTADSHVLYKESDIVGSKLPNIQTNSSSNICAIIGAIIGLIFFAIVAVVLSIVSFGALAAPLFAALVPTIGTVGALLVTVAVTGVIGAVIGAVISAINQGILIAAGLQESFDWTQFGADVVMGFIGGVTGGLSALSAAGKIATALAKVATVVAEIALDSAGEVARQAISNNGRIDNPWTIIAAGAGAGFGAVASKAVRVQSQANGKLSGLLTRKIVSIKPGFKGAGSALEAAQAARQVVPTKAQNVLVKGLKAGALDNLAEGTTVFKSGTTKFVRSVGPDGAPILKQVERTAVKAGKEVSLGHKLTGAFQDFKLVRVGDEVLRVPRMSAGKTVLQRVGASIRNFGKSAAEAVKSVPKQVKAAFAEQRAVDQAAKLAKPKTLTKAEVAVAYSDAPKAVQGQRGFTSVQRNKSLVDKGYTTLAKSDTDSLGNRIARKFGRGVQTNTLPAGTKLVKVGEEVQVWRRVSAQYTVGQRINRKLAATSLGSTPVIKRLFDNFRLDAPLSKTASGDKAVRSGFRRVFDVSTDSFQEITATTVKRRLTAEGTNLLANKANFVKAKLLDAKDSIIDALPLSKSKLLQTAVKVGTSVTLLSLRNYDNFSYFIPYTSTIGKTLALAALKEPRATFNNWLLNQSLSGFATPDKPLANAAVKGIRSSLYGLEQRWHQWLPFDWVATGANVLSRVQSPVDLDYNQTAEQRLRSTKLGAGQTAAFDLGSVFDYSADLDGRITDNTIPLLALSNLPPVPAAGSLRSG